MSLQLRPSGEFAISNSRRFRRGAALRQAGCLSISGTKSRPLEGMTSVDSPEGPVGRALKQPSAALHFLLRSALWVLAAKCASLKSAYCWCIWMFEEPAERYRHFSEVPSIYFCSNSCALLVKFFCSSSSSNRFPKLNGTSIPLAMPGCSAMVTIQRFR